MVIFIESEWSEGHNNRQNDFGWLLQEVWMLMISVFPHETNISNVLTTELGQGPATYLLC